MSAESILKVLESVFPIPAAPVAPVFAIVCCILLFVLFWTGGVPLTMEIIPEILADHEEGYQRPRSFRRAVRLFWVSFIVAVGCAAYGIAPSVRYFDAMRDYETAVDFRDGKLTRAANILAQGDLWEWDAYTIFYDEKDQGIDRYYGDGFQRVEGIRIGIPDRVVARTYLGKTSTVTLDGSAAVFFKEDFARIVAALERSGVANLSARLGRIEVARERESGTGTSADWQQRGNVNGS